MSNPSVSSNSCSALDRELASVEGHGVEADADWDHLQTPETYLGYYEARTSRYRVMSSPMHLTPTSLPTLCASIIGPLPANGR